MTRTGFDRLIQFWELAYRLKREPRRGWKRTQGIRKVESVADHSFALALLALYEGERREQDVGIMLKLALIHDLEEAITGDLTPTDKSRMGAEEVERVRRKAKSEILARFPVKSRSAYRRLWKDLNEGGSPEARMVRELDKVEMALQAEKYGRYLAERDLDGFYMSARTVVKDPTLRSLLKAISQKSLG